MAFADSAATASRRGSSTPQNGVGALAGACSIVSLPPAPFAEEHESHYHCGQQCGESNQSAPLDSNCNDHIAVLLEVCAHAAEPISITDSARDIQHVTGRDRRVWCRRLLVRHSLIPVTKFV